MLCLCFLFVVFTFIFLQNLIDMDPKLSSPLLLPRTHSVHAPISLAAHLPLINMQFHGFTNFPILALVVFTEF